MEKAPAELVDIGANLTHRAFRRDLGEVLARAREAGVTTLIVTGSDARESERAQALAAEHPGRLYATAGFHPHHARTFDTDSPALLRELAATPEVVAVGETGLDFFRDHSPRPVQERVFEAHLELAAELRLPVFLHQRDAHERFLAILRDYRDHLVDAVAHCFTGDKRMLFDYLDLDLHVGVTGWICDERRGEALREAAPHVPAERLMIETDCPYLTPRDLRPKPPERRNEPAFLPHILAAVAARRSEDPADLAAGTTAVARRFFRLPEPAGA